MSEVRVFRANDGYLWNYRRWAADAASPRESRGEIVILHGIQSHGGWYLGTCQWLRAQNWNVSLLDRRGCGLNEAGRGDAPSFRRLVDDVAEYLWPLPRPTILMGISWGGKLAVALQKRHPGLCSGLVLVTPGLAPRVRPPFADRLAIFFSRFVAPRKLFPIPLNEPELFTGNRERRAFIAADPLALRQATARLLFESARMDIYLRFAPKYVTVPTLMLLAGRDQIIDTMKTRDFAARFAGPTEVIEYPEASHTLEFEPGGPPFCQDLSRWLARLPAGGSHNTNKPTEALP